MRQEMIAGHCREVCGACGYVHYRNPLPVASSIVVNDAGEVLLVRRRNEPSRGEWCLPVGFAETGETIRQAALRKLLEETGIEGEILSLVDVESEENPFYGDMLFVTFAVAKKAGVEAAGDDADDVGYFLLQRAPALAFRAHELALQTYREGLARSCGPKNTP